MLDRSVLQYWSSFEPEQNDSELHQSQSRLDEEQSLQFVKAEQTVALPSIIQQCVVFSCFSKAKKDTQIRKYANTILEFPNVRTERRKKNRIWIQ